MTLRIDNLNADFAAEGGSDWNLDDATNTIVVNAPPFSDIFVDPGGKSTLTTETRHNAATLMTAAPDGDFQFRARVHVNFANAFDAGVLLLRVDELTWGKLCFEFSPSREPMVVSVVNNGSVSDDANAFVVDGDHVYLRIARKGRVYGLHASLDGSTWTFVRAFAFDNDGQPEVGFEAQSPNAETCKVEFSHYNLERASLADFRDGT